MGFGHMHTKCVCQRARIDGGARVGSGDQRECVALAHCGQETLLKRDRSRELGVHSAVTTPPGK